VAGADKHRRDYARLAARLHVAEHVRLLGPLADVRPLLHAADAFVQPALYDPLPNAALEALACGLPVVTSRKSGAAELIEHARNGWLVDALDVDGVAAGMRTLARAGAAGATGPMRSAARAAVEPLSIERMGRDLTGLYRLLTAGAEAPAIPGAVRIDPARA
jgi:UDP-glucose:(heptosyl)LPS alpha-1,3-glucosyltransferase